MINIAPRIVSHDGDGGYGAQRAAAVGGRRFEMPKVRREMTIQQESTRAQSR